MNCRQKTRFVSCHPTPPASPLSVLCLFHVQRVFSFLQLYMPIAPILSSVPSEGYQVKVKCIPQCLKAGDVGIRRESWWVGEKKKIRTEEGSISFQLSAGLSLSSNLLYSKVFQTKLFLFSLTFYISLKKFNNFYSLILMCIIIVWWKEN